MRASCFALGNEFREEPKNEKSTFNFAFEVDVFSMCETQSFGRERLFVFERVPPYPTLVHVYSGGALHQLFTSIHLNTKSQTYSHELLWKFSHLSS
jgi:hypothetical protein